MKLPRHISLSIEHQPHAVFNLSLDHYINVTGTHTLQFASEAAYRRTIETGQLLTFINGPEFPE